MPYHRIGDKDFTRFVPPLNEEDRKGLVRRAKEFLRGGYAAEEKKKIVWKYLDSDREREGRLALFRLLLDDEPSSQQRTIRHLLALMFHPTEGKKFNRYLIFRRSSGKQPHNLAMEMLDTVGESVGKSPKVEAGIAEAARRFSVSERTVWRVYEKWLLQIDPTNIPNWTSVKNKAVSLGQIIKRDNAASLQICSAAGTAGNGAEPDFSDMAGTTTADNTVTWTSLGVIRKPGKTPRKKPGKKLRKK